MFLLWLQNPDKGPRDPLHHFNKEFADCFDPKSAPAIDEKFVEVAIHDPDATPSRLTDMDIGERRQEPEPDQDDAEALERIAAEELTNDVPPPVLPPDILSGLGNPGDGIPGGGHGGCIMPWPKDNKSTSPECLAFYLPIHFYYPTAWGIYLLLEGVMWLASYLLRATGGSISKSEAVAVARKFLYYHEAFHHKTECFAIRLEMTQRLPAYKTGFSALYRSKFNTDDCHEEALANADALLHSKWTTNTALRALHEWVETSPPGYRKGVEVKDDFRELRNFFAEENQQACFPSLPSKNHLVWGAAPRMFDGLPALRNNVNYLVAKDSPLLSRMPLRPLLPPRKAIKKLEELAGLKFKRAGANHDIYQTPDGKNVPIPRHAKNLNRKVLRNILKQCGLQMGLEEFLRL